MRMQRIEVGGRRFGYKVGVTFVAFKEYGAREKKLSFAIPCPDAIGRKQIRAEILKRIGAQQ